ncbi:CRISPR-associated helicase/endonuclease Cas3 [Allostella vacuolata]|nr:CRISPR-associated helicase/endonuclease Cas3 [Stella vacuolata]
MLSPFREFWGKAQPVSGGAGACWHPLWMHSLDVAAVGMALADRHPAPFHHVAGRLGWSPCAFRQLWGLMLALHDIGKFSRPFQKKSPPHWPTAALGPLDGRTADLADPGHSLAGMGLLLDSLADEWSAWLPGWRTPQVAAMFGPVLGHHGRPVAGGDSILSGAPGTSELFGRAAQDAARAFVREAVRLFSPEPLPAPRMAALRQVSWRLAGVAVVADWIGSNQRWFPYAVDVGQPVRAYWSDVAEPQAQRALAEAGILPAPVRPFGGLAQLAPRPGLTPSPVQAWAERVDLPPGPLLFVLEDMTGSGKTEAALLLAHRLMAAGRAHGLYLALPTMATANAMYARMGSSYRRLFAEDATPSLVLAHGRAALDAHFRQSIIEAPAGQRSSGSGDSAEDDCAAECAAWLALDRRKAFLADVGVGTIDQALLAVLPAKHQAIRLAALADRVLIVDEVHAYDAYMGAEIDRLVAAQAMQGGHTILLSATLPRPVKARIASAWGDAAGATGLVVGATHYPAATLLAPGRAAIEAPLPARADLPRRLRVRRLPGPEAAVEAICQAAAQGAAVAWIRNTVDDAIAGAAMLRDRGIGAALFHARFAMGHRLAIEQDVVGRFGRAGDGNARRGQVLVATQVVEQSLDLDFDLVVSDLAPIDLLLQRAGRVWRHLDLRPAAHRPVPGPELLVVSPHPDRDAGRDWIGAVQPGTAAVYRDHARLWLTAHHLFASTSIAIPDEVPTLIEAVYGTDAPVPIPPPLDPARLRAEGDARGERAHALANLLDLNAGYSRAGQPWNDEARVATRLSEERRTLRLARWDGTRLSPLCPDPDPSRAWMLSEVSIAARRISRAAPATAALEHAIGHARATWGRYEAEILLMPLEAAGLNLFRWAIAPSEPPLIVSYCTALGLRFGP